uniref:Plant heme peroxidase family profile domain-containing protein n=1 Tax=Triticum urartu TaxID=4572 RepID=A0A8R7UG07_TRIUA
MAVHHLLRRGISGGSPLHPLRGLLVSQELGRRQASSAAAGDAVAELRGAREDVKQLLKEKSCHPILVRLGWHDAGTYDKNINEWPKCGGANGSLRFEIELKHSANAGLVNALKLIQAIKDKYAGVTYADLFQLASATAVEEAGGPKIPMIYGRVDVSAPEQCPPEGRLPAAGPSSPAEHLREVFYRMGLNDKVLGYCCVTFNSSIQYTSGVACLIFFVICRKLLHCQEHTHLDDQDQSAAAGVNLKQNTLKMDLVHLGGNLGHHSGSSLITAISRMSKNDETRTS